MAEIRLSGINKVYPGGTHAVHDVDLHIADGEFMIMVGPSGCAKSTILRMIAGLETPTSGTLEIGGRVVNDVAPKDRDIAMVFQSYALYPHMTVRENMAFGLKLRRMPQQEIDQRVAEAARILGLEQLLDRLPKAMSGGQRQRVAMGRAIVREPQAFLMDEPLSNLDAKLRVQMRTEIAKLHQRLETTTVYVTHDQVEAMTLGQRICILRKGVVQQVDTPFQVYQNPANVFVGGFIGSPGMNFMNGHLVLHDGVLYVQLGEQHLPVPASVSSRLLASTDVHGRGVIVGIRPEHLSLSAPGDPGAIPVQVELTEAMGSEVYAYFTAAVTSPDLSALSDTQATSTTYVARLGAGTETRGGEQIMLRPDMDEIHLFDAQTLLTLLAPANEAQVRQRQGGAAIQLASGMAGATASPVAAPQATLVQPVQSGQVILHTPIHLHQTIMQPEQPVYGTLAEPASPAAIANVFDQPVAAPVQVEPLVVGAADGVSPPIAAPVVAPYASSLGHGGDELMGGRPAEAQLHAGTPIAEPVAPVAAVAAAGAPVEPEAEAAEADEPAAPVRRGFAPRVIGEATLPAPVAGTDVASDEPAAGDEESEAPTVVLQGEQLDAAIEAIEAVDAGHELPIEGSTLGATMPGDVEAPAPESVTYAPIASLRGTAGPAAPNFRDALERIRGQRPAHVPTPHVSSGILPPPVTLGPTPYEDAAAGHTDAAPDTPQG